MRFGDASLTDYYQQRIEVPFFNYYLLGKGDGGELAGATIFFTGENRWRTFEEWPPADARKEVLFLRSNGALSAERPIERESFSGYRSDPASPVPYDFPMRASRDKAYMVADQRFGCRSAGRAVFHDRTAGRRRNIRGRHPGRPASGDLDDRCRFRGQAHRRLAR